MQDRKSLADKLGWPDSLRVTLVLASIVLAASPYLGGRQVGSVPIPAFAEPFQSALRVGGPILVALSLALLLPLFRSPRLGLSVLMDETYAGGLKSNAKAEETAANTLLFLDSRWWVSSPSGEHARVIAVRYTDSDTGASKDADFFFLDGGGQMMPPEQFIGTAHVGVVAAAWVSPGKAVREMRGRLNFVDQSGHEFETPLLFFRGTGVEIDK